MSANMNTQSSQNSQKKKKRKALKFKEPSDTVSKYLGPIDTPAVKEASDVHSLLMTYGGTLASDGSGVLAPVFDPYSQASSSANWTSAAALFSEFRILAYKFVFMPKNKFNKDTTVTVFPGYAVVDRASNSALSSISQATAFASVLEVSLEGRWQREIRMDSVEEAQFISTASSPATSAKFFLKLFANGLTASYTYGQYVSYTLVQFRGTQ